MFIEFNAFSSNGLVDIDIITKYDAINIIVDYTVFKEIRDEINNAKTVADYKEVSEIIIGYIPQGKVKLLMNHKHRFFELHQNMDCCVVGSDGYNDLADIANEIVKFKDRQSEPVRTYTFQCDLDVSRIVARLDIKTIRDSKTGEVYLSLFDYVNVDYRSLVSMTKNLLIGMNTWLCDMDSDKVLDIEYAYYAHSPYHSKYIKITGWKDNMRKIGDMELSFSIDDDNVLRFLMFLINTMRYICKTDLPGQQKDREELFEASSILDGLL